MQMLASENNVSSFDYAEWTESRVIKTHAGFIIHYSDYIVMYVRFLQFW